MGQIKRLDTEVLITGGSLEGCIAAVTLAKKGRQVLLTTKRGSLGGISSNGLETYLSPEKIQGETAESYGRLLKQQAGEMEGVTGPLYHDQKCKLVLAKLLKDAGVTVLTHIFPFEAMQNDTGMICRAECKTETLEIHSKAVIEAEPFLDMAGMTDIPWKRGKASATGAVKWNCIAGDLLKEYLEPGYEEGEGYIAGMLNLGYVKKEKDFCYGEGLVKCYHSKKFGETIIRGIKIQLPELTAFTLSQANAGLRMYAYELRNQLRATKKGFEEASIIHIAPELDLYGVRCVADLQYGRLFFTGLEEYSNEKALEAGVAAADRVNTFLE